jgi:putative ABC transport system permease protein
LLQDLRFGARIFARSPGIAILVLLTMALGIGANSAMFAVVDALLLHPVDYDNLSELAVVWDRDAQGQLRLASAGNFLDWRGARSFDGLASWTRITWVLSGLERPVQITGARVTANMFDVLGVRPAIGRSFLEGEDGLDGQPGSRVAIIAHGLWQDVLGSDPNILGRQLRLNGTPYTVVGVMPPGFRLLLPEHQIWTPATIDGSDRDYRYLTVLGRRRVPLGEAAAEMETLSASLAQSFPASNRGWTAEVKDFLQELVDTQIRTRLLLLFGAVGLVLLLACSNIASLLLTRSMTRGREIALRASLGATRARLIGQLLTESVALALMGGLLGLGLAAILVRAAPAFVPSSAIPSAGPIQLNGLVVAFSLGAAVAAGVLFGIAPALASSRPDVQRTLQDASRGSTGGRGRTRFRQAMVTIQVAAALVLLASAALMAENLRKLSENDPGVDPANTVTLRVVLPVSRYDRGRAQAFHRQAAERIEALPGVERAALTSRLPLMPPGMEVPFDPESTPPRDMAAMQKVWYTTITPGFLEAVRLPLLRGRDVSRNDTAESPGVAWINDAFARRYFAGQDPIGKRLRVHLPVLGSNSLASATYVEIAGVTGNATLGLLGAPFEPILYVPAAQNWWTASMWLVVRTRPGAPGVTAAIRNIVGDLDREQPVDQAGSLEELFATHFREPRFQSQLMTAFAGLALVLAMTGIYGVNAHAVTQQRREIGVRMALGADPARVRRDVLARGMRLTGAGIALGLAGSAAAGTILGSVLVDMSAMEPAPLLAAAVLLAAVATIACYIPARRATRIDPAIALREE